ncbi:MAG: hypothetical protein IJ667_12335 [Synergistaceae bacterium]|nr:hypothetical protein [Synergistaceae bacterium]
MISPQKERAADTAMIAITGIHGNFCSNPFYYNIGDTLSITGGFDFVYATHSAKLTPSTRIPANMN